MERRDYRKLRPGDKVAVLSPSFAAPAKWPEVYELGLQRIREEFALEPVAFPSTCTLAASAEERIRDLIAAFEDPSIAAVIASLGGNDQVTYVSDIPPRPFVENPKPFFGFSDNTHFENFLWRHGISSYYGGSLFTQFAMQGGMEPFTTEYLRYALFGNGVHELQSSPIFNDVDLDWGDSETLQTTRTYEPSEGWYWDGAENARGVTWGGCLESIDKLFQHNVELPTLTQFENILLFTETSEEVPSSEYVATIYRMLGERGILERVRGILVGRPKAWSFDTPQSPAEKRAYREEQRRVTLQTIREFNPSVPVVMNLDIGHTNPQICLPNGREAAIDVEHRKIYAEF